MDPRRLSYSYYTGNDEYGRRVSGSPLNPQATEFQSQQTPPQQDDHNTQIRRPVRPYQQVRARRASVAAAEAGVSTSSSQLGRTPPRYPRALAPPSFPRPPPTQPRAYQYMYPRAGQRHARQAAQVPPVSQSSTMAAEPATNAGAEQTRLPQGAQTSLRASSSGQSVAEPASTGDNDKDEGRTERAQTPKGSNTAELTPEKKKKITIACFRRDFEASRSFDDDDSFFPGVGALWGRF